MADTPKTLQEAYSAMMKMRSTPAPAEENGAAEQPSAEPASTTPDYAEATENAVNPAVNNVTNEPADTVPAPNAADPYAMMSQQTEALKNATGMVRQMQSQNQSMAQEIERLKAVISEQNNAAEVSEMRAAATPPAPPRVPSFDELAYLSDEEKLSKQNEYASQMAEYIKSQAIADIQPYIEKAKAVERMEAEEAILSRLSDARYGYADFGELLPVIKSIVKNNPLIAGADINDDKYITAYAIAKGIKANQPKEAKLKLTDEDKKLLSNDELLEIYKSNPDFQKLIAQEQIGKVREAENIPPFSAGGDAANVALNTVDKPKTFEDAKKGMLQKIQALRGGNK